MEMCVGTTERYWIHQLTVLLKCYRTSNEITLNKQAIGDYSLLISKLFGEIKFVLIKVLTAVLVRVYVHCVECCSCS